MTSLSQSFHLVTKYRWEIKYFRKFAKNLAKISGWELSNRVAYKRKNKELLQNERYVKLLGIWIDDKMTFEKHIKTLLQSKGNQKLHTLMRVAKVYSKSPCTNSRFANISRTFGPNRKNLGLVRAIVLLFILRAK